MTMLETFVSTQCAEVERTLSELNTQMYGTAAEIIWQAESRGNRVHITGIGKPAHIASYIASLMSSTGTPTYFLLGTEAVHGSCGQLCAGRCGHLHFQQRRHGGNESYRYRHSQ